MSEPKRWLDDGAPEVVERLLVAAGREQPSQASLARTLATLGVGVGVVSTAAAAGAKASSVGAAGLVGAAKGSTLASVLVLKGTLFGAGLGAIFVVVGVVAFPQSKLSQPAPLPSPRAPAPMSSSFHSVGSQPLSSAPAVQVAELIAKSARPLPRRAGQGSAIQGNESPSEASTPIDTEQLGEEVRAVDHARSALEAGRASSALAALDSYDARFPGQRFAPEVLYLRVEALLRLGRRSEARAIAENLVMSYPNSPQAERARQVLSRSIP